MNKAEQDLLDTMRSKGASPGECRVALTLVSLGLVDASKWVNHYLGADQMVRMFGQPVHQLPPLDKAPDPHTLPPGRGDTRTGK